MDKEISKQNLNSVPAPRVSKPFSEMERFLDRFSRRFSMNPWRLDWPDMWVNTFSSLELPKVDIVDFETEIVLKAELPGVNKKDLDISVNEDSVTIKASTRQEQKTEKTDYYLSETSQGVFSRTVGLPASVEGRKAKATLKDGILEIKLPKMKSSARHTINVD